MRCNKMFVGLMGIVLSGLVGVTQAGVISIAQYSGFFYSSTLGSTSLEHTSIGYDFDEMTGAGVTTTFTNNLDADNLGSVSWNFSNDTGGVLSDAWFFVFLDAEFDQAINTFFNEFGGLASVIGTGAGDIYADAWEIDEPGYIFGDIYDHLLAGTLDNSNGVPEGAEDDVSLALGFNLGNLNAGDRVVVDMFTSRLDIGGLFHGDADSADLLYWNGTALLERFTPVPVSEPGTLAFVLGGLLFAGFARRYQAAR